MEKARHENAYVIQGRENTEENVRVYSENMKKTRGRCIGLRLGLCCSTRAVGSVNSEQCRAVRRCDVCNALRFGEFIYDMKHI